MKNIYQSRAVAVAPELPSTAVEGYPSNGSSTGGQLATVPGAYWYFMITEEIMNAIKGGGITPKANVLTQLNQSIDVRLAALAGQIQESMDSLADKLAQQGIPTGFICAASVVKNYDYWLPCDGSARSRVTYKDLFSLIGTTYGAGDGSTTFNLPDLRGEFLRGLDQGRGVDKNRKIGSAQGDAMRNFTGTFGGGGQNRNTIVTGVFYDTGENQNVADDANTNAKVVGFDPSRVVPTANENRPRNVAVPYYIHI